MADPARSGARRAVCALGAALMVLAGLVARPEFTRSESIPFAIPPFADQWHAAESPSPNFWGPALAPGAQEQYQQSPGGVRTVQYFDKARMEQTQPGGAVTNGLLTVELVSGKRQLGDALFSSLLPSALSIVGDVDNSWPPYSALGSAVFPNKVARSGEPTGIVYQPDGTFALNRGLAAFPGAAFGSYETDPGGRYGHNVPLAFSAYLQKLPVAWQTAMGFPLTEAFWANVRVAGVPTWVMVQPYERRVLSYTPTNPDAFQVEMGNIGQHYYAWRYGVTHDTATATQNMTGTAVSTAGGTTTVMARASGTPMPLAITNVQLGAVTDTSFAITFKTSVPATSSLLYGTASHAYANEQAIAATATLDHAVTLTDLTPGTKYYFAIRVKTNETSVERKEDYFATTGVAPSVATSGAGSAQPSATTQPAASATATHTATPTRIPTNSPTSVTNTATPVPTATFTPVPPKNVHISLTQITVTGTNFNAPDHARVDGTTVTTTLSYQGASGTITNAASVTTWTVDQANAKATSSGTFAPVALTDKHLAMTITTTITIPFVDPTSPSLVVTYTRTITPEEYAAGNPIASPVLSNAKIPGYSVTLVLVDSLS